MCREGQCWQAGLGGRLCGTGSWVLHTVGAVVGRGVFLDRAVLSHDYS